MSPAAATAQPTQVSPPTREELQRRPPSQRPAPPAQLRVEDELQRAPCALDTPESANIRFTPTEVTFDNLRGLPAERLREAYAPYLGREQPIKVVCEIRDRAATILREAGYVASVEVPQQRIADGRIRFDVLMARLTAIRVRGNGGRAERLIASYLEPLTRQQVFNRFEAERHLLLVNDLPGYVVRLSLRSSEGARGEVIGEVTLLRAPGYADLSIQNFGSEALGPWGAAIQGQLNDLTGLGDRTSLSAYSTLDFGEQYTGQLAHEFRIGGSGLSMAGQITYGFASPDLGDPALNLESDTWFGSIEVGYPFIRSQTRNLRGSIGFELIDQDVRFNGLDLSRDRLRVAFARLSGDWQAGAEGAGYSTQEPRWRFGGLVELRQGLDILGASQPCPEGDFGCNAAGAVPPSRIDGDPQATVLRGSAYGEFRPRHDITLSLGGRVQHSDSSLYSFEEFSIGNYTVGRGYDPGVALGDRGAGVQAEVRYGSVYQPDQKGIAAEVFAFVDQAWVGNEPLFGSPSEDVELTSIGAGIRLAFRGLFRLEAVIAAPVDRVEALDRVPDPRLLISFSTSLWPWRF